MNLSIEKEVEDARGKIIFLSNGDKKIHMVEIKKGFARAGHFHKFPSIHILISGFIEYREKNILDEHEQIKKIKAPAIIKTPPNLAHLLIALEETLLIEIFEQSYEATIYEKYHKIVDEKITNA